MNLFLAEDLQQITLSRSITNKGGTKKGDCNNAKNNSNPSRPATRQASEKPEYNSQDNSDKLLCIRYIFIILSPPYEDKKPNREKLIEFSPVM